MTDGAHVPDVGTPDPDLNTSPIALEGVEDLRPFHTDNRYDREQRRPHCRVTADPSGHANRPA